MGVLVEMLFVDVVEIGAVVVAIPITISLGVLIALVFTVKFVVSLVMLLLPATTGMTPVIRMMVLLQSHS